ncbi:hypothetical protein [Luteolibacter luteus]|uniref:DUF3618 domain-containing protein n=1 Tax=Luteolibacter luteus TaxID=2728835 RepID=A0A858RFT9_9BACT|nr:hypothetical protein [Luteolibacter luteus]QJE95418.1 hypothetical protein HHL09_06360 [Luteolibacter luteus]
MASQSQGQAEALIARIAASRVALAADLAEVRRRLDVPTRMKESILSKPLAWFGGSLGAGFLASALLKKKRVPPAEKAKRGFLAVVLGGLFTMARPALQNWALQEARKRFAIPRNDIGPHS